MFWFLLVALVVVVAAVTLVVVGGDDGVVLRDAQPDRLDDQLPADRPVGRADLEALRLPMTVRGYRMTDVDDVLGRLGAELAERDARIAELEAALAGAQAAALGSSPVAENGRGGERPGAGAMGRAGEPSGATATAADRGAANGDGTPYRVQDPGLGADAGPGFHAAPRLDGRAGGFGEAR